MIDKIQLYINAITTLKQFGNVGLIILTDKSQSKQVSILSEVNEISGMNLFLKKSTSPENSLLSVLWKIISMNTSCHYEVYVENVQKGKYQVFLQNEDMTNRYELDPVGAMTLAAMADLPIYISYALFVRQSTDFNSEKGQMSLPLNALNITVLEHALHKAIDTEDYMMASVIKKEIDNRKK